MIQFPTRVFWLLYSEEHNDKFFNFLFGNETTAPVLALVTNVGCHLIVSNLDVENVNDPRYMREHQIISVVAYKTSDEMWSLLGKAIEKMRFPPQIALNFSLTDSSLDVLTHGNYLKLEAVLRGIYGSRKMDIYSAEETIIPLFEVHSENDIDLMRLSASVADEVLDSVFSRIEIGMTEKEIARLVLATLENSPYQDTPYYFTPSWEGVCPIVLTGENFAKGGHAAPSDRPLQAGDTIYFDFGVKMSHPGMQKNYCSDIQRMGYCLEEWEDEPPEEVQHIFDTLVEAIEKGRMTMREGVFGFVVDAAVRGTVTEAGYSDYSHGTGHPVGHMCHGLGTLLTKEDNPRSRRTIKKNGIYTIEPRIQMPNGGSLEEMVVVTEKGCEYVSQPQKRLYLIR